jgi:hypothetical protein
MLRIPHCLDNGLTNVGLSTGPALLPRNLFLILVLISVRGLSEHQGLVRPEGLGTFKTIRLPHRVSNPRPSGLWHTDFTTTLPPAQNE